MGSLAALEASPSLSGDAIFPTIRVAGTLIRMVGEGKGKLDPGLAGGQSLGFFFLFGIK